MSGSGGEGSKWADGDESDGIWGFGVKDMKDLEMGRGGGRCEEVVSRGWRVRVGGRGGGGCQEGARRWEVKEVFPSFGRRGVMRMLASL